MQSFKILFVLFALLLAGIFTPLIGQTSSDPPLLPHQNVQDSSTSPEPGQLNDEARKEKAEQQVKQQERQRILGVFPNFNSSYIPDAVALNAKQKFQLALKAALDPVTFGVAGFDAAISQAENDYAGYGQGAQGYFKRWGASYADTFDGDMIGNAVFPVLLHQDPRYFRKGVGSFSSRLWYAVLTTVRCKGDNGKWQPNFSNVLGNIAAGGISNLYYPSTDRGAGLTFQRAFTVTAEGSIGAILVEFWPDISHHFRKHN